jgi:hypothetical protein
LAATFAAPLASVAANPEPLFPTGLDWKPGPACTYDIDHNGKKARWTFTVTGVDGDKTSGVWTRSTGEPASVPVVKTENGAKFTEDMSLIHGTPMTADPGYQWIAFPLEPGKKWEGRSVVSGMSAAGKPWKVDVSYTSKVDGWEKVSIAGKSNLALKIVTEEKIAGLSANFSGTAKGSMWIGPGACSIKKLEYKNSFKETANLVLVSE